MEVLLNGKIHPMLQNAAVAFRSCYIQNPMHGFRYPFFCPGGYLECWWEIDSSFAAEGFSYFDYSVAKKAVENFCYVQKEDGRIPLYGIDTLPTTEHHPLQSHGASALPALFLAAYSIVIRTNDADFLRKMLTMLYRYLMWWESARMDPETGLLTALFEETFPPYLRYPGEYAPVDTNAAVAIGADLTAKLALHLGETAVAEKCLSVKKALFHAIRKHLWDENEGLFRPLYLKDRTFGSRSAAAFYLFADEELPDRMKARLLENLKGDAFNWNSIPVSSMSRNDAAFTLTKTEDYQFNDSWSGMVWTLINRYISYGLHTSALTDEAVYLAEKTVELVSRDVREFYAPDTGVGYGAKQYAWTAAHAVTLFFETLCGVHYDAWNRRLTIRPQTDETITVRDLPLGDGTFVSFELSNRAVRDFHLDSPFAIELTV